MNRVYENGYVTLPIEKYEELKEQAVAGQKLLNSLITIKEGYRGDELEVHVNSVAVYNEAVKLIKATPELEEDFTIKSPASFTVWGTAIAERKKEDIQHE